MQPCPKQLEQEETERKSILIKEAFTPVRACGHTATWHQDPHSKEGIRLQYYVNRVNTVKAQPSVSKNIYCSTTTNANVFGVHIVRCEH